MLLGLVIVALCAVAARAEDDWPFGSPSPSGTPAGTTSGLPIIRHGRGGKFKEGEVEAAIAALKPGDYYEQNVPKLTLEDLQTQGPAMAGQVVKLKWNTREPALEEGKDGCSMPEVQLREDKYNPRGDFINSTFAFVKVPPDGMDFVKRIPASQVIIWDHKAPEFVAYALILKGGKAVFLGHEITEPTPVDPAKFVW